VTTPEQYTPRDLTALDALAAAKRTVDALMRSNPLTNAVVSNGLMKWIGNHLDGGGNKINFLWIGEFFPADTTLGGRAQRGISMVRDDSTGGQSAFALYDHDPGGGGLGLRQTIHWGSLDAKRLFSEARNGGQQWPQENIAMGTVSMDILDWTKTPFTPDNTFHTLAEGRVNVVGKHIIARYWAATTGGANGEFRVRIEGASGDIFGPTNTLGVNVNTAFEDQIDVSSERGDTRTIRLEVRTPNATGNARIQIVSFRCYTNLP
jgi:hypothetical protein